MKKIHSYNLYQALEAINEAIDELIDQVDTEEGSQIQDLVDQQEEIYKRYDLSDQEKEVFRTSSEDSIRTRLGVDFEM